jgi:hypothetical protein
MGTLASPIRFRAGHEPEALPTLAGSTFCGVRNGWGTYAF